MIGRCVAFSAAFVGGWVLRGRVAKTDAVWAELRGYARGATDAGRWYADALTPRRSR